MADHCVELNSRGEPCQAPCLPGREYCYMHDPDNAEEAQRVRTIGGQNRRTPSSTLYPGDLVSLTDFDGLLNWVNALLRDCWELEPSARRARAIVPILKLASDLFTMLRGQASLTKSEVQWLISNMRGLVIEFIPDPARQRAFINRTFELIPSRLADKNDGDQARKDNTNGNEHDSAG